MVFNVQVCETPVDGQAARMLHSVQYAWLQTTKNRGNIGYKG